MTLNRRAFLRTAALTSAVPVLGADTGKPRIGLIRSDHPGLPRPTSPADPLDYPRVRDMVWRAIEYGRPNARSLEDKIPEGAWVVVKPNIVFLKPQEDYTTGGITDFRVTGAVVE